MAFYIKEFDTHANYEVYSSSTEFILPNVSICDDNPDLNHVHYHPYVPDPYNGYEYVDLGLPSGLKWAKHYIGADSGDTYSYKAKYFAWGDTIGYSANTYYSMETHDFSWENTPFNNGSDDYDETYFKSVSGTVCPNGILAPEYDAAHVIMGGNWRMPSLDDFKELIDTANTSHEVKTFGNVSGMLLTSNINSNTLFLPFIGDRVSTVIGPVGSAMYLWSASLNTSAPYNASYLGADSSVSSSIYWVYGEYRRIGYGVLGVCSQNFVNQPE